MPVQHKFKMRMGGRNMSQSSITLVRTVFLPMGSPPIGSVYEIRTDISKADINVESGQLYCMGDMDILIDYLSYAPDAGKQLFSAASNPYPQGRGKEWQALLNLPFVLNEKTTLPSSAVYKATVGKIKWFMVAPRALEMEMEIIISDEIVEQSLSNNASKEQKKDGGSPMLSINDENNEWEMTETASAEEEDAIANLSYEERPITTTDTAFEDEFAHKETVDNYIPPGHAEAVDYESLAENGIIAQGHAEAMDAMTVSLDDIPDLDTSDISSLKSSEPEIVKIVFNNDTPVNDEIIRAAVLQAKAELAIPAAPVQEEAVTASAAPAALAKPKRKSRVHGLPQFALNTGDEDADNSAFNINIKMP